MVYDVIIVGAGPAGASSAYFLALAGLKVLLLEKKKLPRFKACGGGISLKFLRSLSFDSSPAITGQVSRVKYFNNLADPFEVELDSPLAMVNRQKFDLLITQKAVKTGANLLDGIRVDGIKVADKKIEVLAGKDKFECRYLIGADGVFSKVAILAGLRLKRKFDLALEVELPEPKHDLSTIYMGFGQVKEGYAWSFPKTDNFSIGVGGKNSPLLVKELDRWLSFLGYPTNDKKALHGHPLPLPVVGEKLHRNNIILVGDAAGLVNPLTGEGIRYAIQSAQIASELIVSGKATDHSREIYERISADFKYAYYLRTLFALFPNFCYRYGVKNPAASKLFSRIFCGEADFKGLYWKALKKIFIYSSVNFFSRPRSRSSKPSDSAG